MAQRAQRSSPSAPRARARKSTPAELGEATAPPATPPPAAAPTSTGGGFRLSRTYRLVFEDDPDFEGLVVRARGLTVEQLLEATALADLAEADIDGLAAQGRGLTPEQRDQVRRLFEMFAERLVSWNVEDEGPDGPDGEGVPVPATLEGVLSQESTGVLRIIRTWLTAVAGVPSSLGKGSTSGATSRALSLPMEPLLASPLS